MFCPVVFGDTGKARSVAWLTSNDLGKFLWRHQVLHGIQRYYMTKRDECCMSYCCVFRMETVLRNGVSVRYLGVGGGCYGIAHWLYFMLMMLVLVQRKNCTTRVDWSCEKLTRSITACITCYTTLHGRSIVLQKINVKLLLCYRANDKSSGL